MRRVHDFLPSRERACRRLAGLKRTASLGGLSLVLFRHDVLAAFFGMVRGGMALSEDARELAAGVYVIQARGKTLVTGRPAVLH